MPIEIRELLIKVAVDENNRRTDRGIDQKELARLKEKIVKECVNTVMQKMSKLSDR
jgi:hypothetical protein